MRKVMIVTRAEQMRRQMLTDYSVKAGKASRLSPQAYCLTVEDRARAARRRRLHNMLKADGAVIC